MGSLMSTEAAGEQEVQQQEQATQQQDVHQQAQQVPQDCCQQANATDPVQMPAQTAPPIQMLQMPAQTAPPIQMPQMSAQRAPPSRRLSSSRNSIQTAYMDFGSFPGQENFNDDDAIPLVETAAASSQPEPDPVVASDAVLTVSTRVEYSALAQGQTQDVFGLVTVQAAAAPEKDPSVETTASDTERQPMDLVYVLDVSGSMQGDKLRQVQDAMRFNIEQAEPKDRLSIVAFNRHASRVLRLRKMDAEGKNNATVETLRLAAGGGTSIASGLSMALSIMEQRRQRNKVSAILLLTDGQDGSTRGQLPGLVTRAQQANCSIYAFGFGKDHDAGLLSELAEQARTPFTFVEDTENIREAFAGAVGGLCSIVAQSVELTLSCHVPLKSVHTAFATQRPSDTSATVTIPDIFAGERRDILVELSVPAGGDAGEHTTLLESHVRYTDLRSGGVVQTLPVVMETMRVEEPQPEAEPDEEVSAQRDRVEVTRALQEAAAQSDQGKFVEAQRVLDAADERVKAHKRKSALSEALCEELSDARGRMQSRSLWEGGGRAEVHDATQMHSMQRSTNLMASSSGMRPKSSKSMYCNASQAASIRKSKGPRVVFDED